MSEGQPAQTARGQAAVPARESHGSAIRYVLVRPAPMSVVDLTPDLPPNSPERRDNPATWAAGYRTVMNRFCNAWMITHVHRDLDRRKKYPRQRETNTTHKQPRNEML